MYRACPVEVLLVLSDCIIGRAVPWAGIHDHRHTVISHLLHVNLLTIVDLMSVDGRQHLRLLLDSHTWLTVVHLAILR